MARLPEPHIATPSEYTQPCCLGLAMLPVPSVLTLVQPQLSLELPHLVFPALSSSLGFKLLLPVAEISARPALEAECWGLCQAGACISRLRLATLGFSSNLLRASSAFAPNGATLSPFFPSPQTVRAIQGPEVRARQRPEGQQRLQKLTPDPALLLKILNSDGPLCVSRDGRGLE